ncbi:MAG TPA: MFS transporter [Rhizomicrobium sp.]|nr:MFS transporter [Rhizomicrobium sp.]
MAVNNSGEIAARLDRLVFSFSIQKLVALVSLGAAFEFYDLFMTAYIAPGLVAAQLYTLTPSGFFAPDSIGFFVFCTFAGMWLGCVGFGFVADRLGRRAIFTLSLLWYCLATMVMAFQHSAAGIDLWRFIAAIGVGLEQVTIDTLLPELVPARGRGRAFAISQFIAFSAVPIVALLAWKLVPLHPFGLEGWRCVALIGSLGALAAWWLRLAVPESPRWLALHSRGAEAESVMVGLEAKVARDIGHALPLERFQEKCEAVFRPEPQPNKEIEHFRDSTKRENALVPPHDTALPQRASLREIFGPSYRRRTLMLSVFNGMQSIAFYGFGSWVPSLLIARGIHVTASLEYAFIIALANPVGPLLGVLVADRMERKAQLVTAGICVAVFMLLFALQTQTLLVLLFGVLVTLSINWISFACHNYQAELYPTRMRARAIGFVYSWSRISAALTGLLIGFFLRQGGTFGVACFIGGAMAVMVVTIGFFGPPTLNRRLEEISR